MRGRSKEEIRGRGEGTRQRRDKLDVLRGRAKEEMSGRDEGTRQR
jgi:hypothetical protein